MTRYSMQILWSDEDDCFIASCPELDDASAFGDTPAKAAKQLEQAIALVVETRVSKKWPLPDPEGVISYSGQLRLRLPKSLHSRVATRARRDGVSLNTFIVTALSEDIGRKSQLDYLLAQFREYMQLEFLNMRTSGVVLKAPESGAEPGNQYVAALASGRPMFVSDGSASYNAKARGAMNG